MKSHFINYFLPFLLILSGCASDGDNTQEADARDKFTGTWKVREESSAGIQNYTSAVSKDPFNSSKVTIGNIYNLGASIKAMIAGGNIYLDQTEVSNYLITGSGSFSGDGFVLNCKATDSEVNSFKATYSR